MNEDVDTSKFPSAGELRQFARGKIATRGMIPNALVKAWNRANPDRPYVKGENFHGTIEGYHNRACHCDRCLEVGRSHARDNYYSHGFGDREGSA
jgi:hypothetical protein